MSPSGVNARSGDSAAGIAERLFVTIGEDATGRDRPRRRCGRSRSRNAVDIRRRWASIAGDNR